MALSKPCFRISFPIIDIAKLYSPWNFKPENNASSSSRMKIFNIRALAGNAHGVHKYNWSPGCLRNSVAQYAVAFVFDARKLPGHDGNEEKWCPTVTGSKKLSFGGARSHMESPSINHPPRAHTMPRPAHSPPKPVWDTHLQVTHRSAPCYKRKQHP